MMIFLRSLVFNIIFYGSTVALCLLYIPTILFPRSLFLKCLRAYFRFVHLLEKYLLGLDYELRGLENLPKDGPFLVAAKHQSAYETMKLNIIFDDPAVILKKELYAIPFWGWYARKADMIAIDRKDTDGAMASIIKGATHMKEMGRPIVIFPQGTRVHIAKSAKDKPYKGGIAKMYDATQLPIIPLALNSGLFWGRNSFIKRPGTVVFDFMPAIEPGLPEKKVMKALEDRIEDRSVALMNEAKDKDPSLMQLQSLAHIPNTK